MANLSIKNQTSKQPDPVMLAIAHNALRKHEAQNPNYIVEDYEVLEDSANVSYYNEHDNRPTIDDTFSLSTIYAFINSFYNNVIDCQINGYHEQFIDHSSPVDYFEENTNEVLTDFLNNRRACND